MLPFYKESTFAILKAFETKLDNYIRTTSLMHPPHFLHGSYVKEFIVLGYIILFLFVI